RRQNTFQQGDGPCHGEHSSSGRQAGTQLASTRHNDPARPVELVGPRPAAPPARPHRAAGGASGHGAQPGPRVRRTGTGRRGPVTGTVTGGTAGAVTGEATGAATGTVT